MVVMTAVIAIVAGCGRYTGSRQTEQEAKKDIPRTHWGITLGDSREKVNNYLKSKGVKKTEKREEMGETWQYISLYDNKIEPSEFFSVSILWFNDKVAGLLLNPYVDEQIAEGVRMKYPLQEYHKGGNTLDEYIYYKYQNDSTRLVMVEHKDWKNLEVYGIGDIRMSRSSEPRCSYDFIYQDLQLLSQKENYEDSVKRAAEQKKKADAIEKASKY